MFEYYYISKHLWVTSGHLKTIKSVHNTYVLLQIKAAFESKKRKSDDYFEPPSKIIRGQDTSTASRIVSGERSKRSGDSSDSDCSSESSNECSTESLGCFSDSSSDKGQSEDNTAKTIDPLESDSNWEDVETDDSSSCESSLSDDSKSSDEVPYPKMAPADLRELDKQCQKEAYEDYLYLREIICPSCKISVPLKFYEEHTAVHGFEYWIKPGSRKFGFLQQKLDIALWHWR